MSLAGAWGRVGARLRRMLAGQASPCAYSIWHAEEVTWANRWYCGRARRAFRCTLTEPDLSSQAVEFAQEQARSWRLASRYFVLDALHDPLPGDYDILVCTLFLHHLDEPNAVSFLLRRMAGATRRLVLVDDLIRSRLGYALAVLGCRSLTRSPIVHNDGPVSVRGAFRLDEVRRMAERAGLYTARQYSAAIGPERFLLSWSRS